MVWYGAVWYVTPCYSVFFPVIVMRCLMRCTYKTNEFQMYHVRCAFGAMVRRFIDRTRRDGGGVERGGGGKGKLLK